MYDEDDEIIFFPRIIGGVPAFHGEFLAKISIQTRRGHHFCGGALIGFRCDINYFIFINFLIIFLFIFVDPRHILTAAHCVTELSGRVIHPDDVKSFANYYRRLN